MFISADCYYDTYIKDKSREEVSSEVERLRADLESLKTAREEDLTEIRKIFPDFPSIAEQIKLKEEYLSRALSALSEL